MADGARVADDKIDLIAEKLLRVRLEEKLAADERRYRGSNQNNYPRDSR